MPLIPRLAWQYVKLIEKRETAHHNVAVNDRDTEENLEIMHPYFNHLFNHKKEVDFTVLEHVAKTKVMYFLDGDITVAKLKRAVTNLKTHKAPGLN